MRSRRATPSVAGMQKQEPSVHLTASTAADPGTVFDLLADLPSHLDWSGTRNTADFRLLSLDGPAGPAREGTVFSSVGTIPMSKRRWEDRSTVTVARRASEFEFVTDSRVEGRRPMLARWHNHYHLAPAPGGGTAISYTLTLLEVTNPFLRLALPGLRALTWRVGIPQVSGRTLRNLVAAAEARTARRPDRLETVTPRA